jgi:hypothetical protein
MYSRLTEHKLKQNVVKDLASGPVVRPPYRSLRDWWERTLGKRLRSFGQRFLRPRG